MRGPNGPSRKISAGEVKIGSLKIADFVLTGIGLRNVNAVNPLQELQRLFCLVGNFGLQVGVKA
jgi:hypothetical protein